MALSIGFGPVIDAMLEAIAERRDMPLGELSTLLHSNPVTEPIKEEVFKGEGIYDWIERYAWDQIIGPAIDELENKIFVQDPESQAGWGVTP